MKNITDIQERKAKEYKREVGKLGVKVIDEDLGSLAFSDGFRCAVETLNVEEMIELLIECKKAISNTNRELFGIGVMTDSTGEEQIYFIKDELLQDIEEILSE